MPAPPLPTLLVMAPRSTGKTPVVGVVEGLDGGRVVAIGEPEPRGESKICATIPCARR